MPAERRIQNIKQGEQSIEQVEKQMPVALHIQSIEQSFEPAEK